MDSYTYNSSSGNHVIIDDTEPNAFVRVGNDEGYFFGVWVPADERQAAAQALAGGQWRVVPTMNPASQADCELCGEPSTALDEIDPADVKVGDVVEVEANDGSWLVRGEVKLTDDIDRSPFRLRFFIPSHRGPSFWLKLTDTTVRLLRRAEPEPDPEQVEALAEVVAIAAGTTTTEVRPDKWEQMARELIRRGVTVQKGA